MPRPGHFRRWLAAFLGGGCWLLAISVASAQIDFRAGSLLDPPATGSPTFPLEVAPPIETLPSVPGEPFPSVERIHETTFGWQAQPALPPDLAYHLGGKGRGYYINDQRLEFTGGEATFAVEGVLDGGLVQHTDGWDVSLETQLFLNQPFGKNVLVDTPERRSFAANFEIDPLQISQLYVGARHGDFFAALGRFVTPFGRFYFPNYRNNFDDSPFIRSEAILFRETGLLLQWDPGIWVCTAALTNGSFQQDTNSSKSLVARVGVDQPWYALGTSVKWQDGNGSEAQKTYNNHLGVDAMVRRGSWTLSGEAIYDQYGLRRPGTALNDITWGRSLYYRDLNNAYHVPITGVGYYMNLGYEGPQWSLMLNYGEFYPQQIGDARQDVTTRRGLIKASRHWTRHFETYGIALLENDLHNAFD
ncbi:MAG TPA: hypothetical protein VKH44_08400, partial [Pirellulaceae bacterium]|nr:hypothetical protein [Pirellulaceae bacterium]